MAPIRKNPTLSYDLISEILVRVPVKSLVRFESVCKTWLSLIKDPAFIKSQLLRAITTQTDQTFIIKRFLRGNTFSVVQVDSRRIVDGPKLPYPRGESEEKCRSRLVGSANGIVCVSVYLGAPPTVIYLWNPAIRQHKIIPSYSVSTHERHTISRFGFGYDPIDDDFKVIRVRDYVHVVEVYSANRNVWRKGKVADPIDDRYYSLVPFRDFDVCVNGFLCGIGQDGMMAFDMNKEVLNCAIKLPFISFISHDDVACVIEFNKCISVIKLMHIGRSDNEIDDEIVERFYEKIKMWTLDDDSCLHGGGVEASWMPVFSLDLDSPTDLSNRYFSEGDFLLLTGPDEEDIDDEEDNMWILRYADMKGVKTVLLLVDMADQPYLQQFHTYTESLVSLAGFRQINWNADEYDD